MISITRLTERQVCCDLVRRPWICLTYLNHQSVEQSMVVCRSTMTHRESAEKVGWPIPFIKSVKFISRTRWLRNGILSRPPRDTKAKESGGYRQDHVDIPKSVGALEGTDILFREEVVSHGDTSSKPSKQLREGTGVRDVCNIGPQCKSTISPVTTLGTGNCTANPTPPRRGPYSVARTSSTSCKILNAT